MSKIVVKTGKTKQRFHESWFRGENVNFIPDKQLLRSENAIDEYILKGWLPEKPFISKEHRITAFGSCFARHITKHLDENGFNVALKDKGVHNSYVIRFGEGLVNTFVIKQQLEWGLYKRNFQEESWITKTKEVLPMSEEVRKETHELLKNTDIFIITLGLSEIWYNKETGNVFWGAIPESLYQEDIHGFRVSSVQENVANLQGIRDLILEINDKAKIIFTLSPVPLMATFRPVSCITASSVSKAILRAAIDEFITGLPVSTGNTFYYPSYEIMLNYFIDPFREDNRHPKQEYINVALSKFVEKYCLS